MMEVQGTVYTIKRLTLEDVDPSNPANLVVWEFIRKTGKHLNRFYGDRYDWNNFPIPQVVKDHYFSICYRDDKPVGLMVGTLTGSIFDQNIKILRQITLYAVPRTQAAYWLLQDFIDFGKVNANHILTNIGTRTNIKPRSLEKLGFSELETLYRMEIK